MDSTFDACLLFTCCYKAVVPCYVFLVCCLLLFAPIYSTAVDSYNLSYILPCHRDYGDEYRIRIYTRRFALCLVHLVFCWLFSRELRQDGHPADEERPDLVDLHCREVVQLWRP